MNTDNVDMEPREPLPFTKRLMEKVKHMRPESQIRLDYYLTHLHHSLDHEVQLHIWPTGVTGVQPAVLYSLPEDERAHPILIDRIPGRLSCRDPRRCHRERSGAASDRLHQFRE